MTFSMQNFSISACSASAACWVEMTTFVMRVGLPSTYSTETCDFASGRSHFASLPALRMRVSSRPRRCAYMIGAGISSGVSSLA